MKRIKLGREDEAKRLIRAIIHCLEVPKGTMPVFILKKYIKALQGQPVTGYYEEDPETDSSKIVLAAYKEIIPTVIHELIHYLKPKWSESKVILYEHTVRRYITIKQLIKVMRLTINHLEGLR